MPPSCWMRLIVSSPIPVEAPVISTIFCSKRFISLGGDIETTKSVFGQNVVWIYLTEDWQFCIAFQLLFFRYSRYFRCNSTRGTQVVHRFGILPHSLSVAPFYW